MDSSNNSEKKPLDYTIAKEGEDRVLLIDCETYPRIPSLEEDPVAMGRAIDILESEPSVTKIIFQQRRNYEYDYDQTAMLKEIATLHSRLSKLQNIPGYTALRSPEAMRCIPHWYAEVQNLSSSILKSDPVAAYVDLKRVVRDETIRMEHLSGSPCLRHQQVYIAFLNHIISLLERTRLIALVKPQTAAYFPAKKEIY